MHQSYEDNEEIMGMTECQVPPEATEFQPSGEETQVEAKEFVQNTGRAAKPSTPIPKSFCSIDDDDDDDSYNPFQVCIHSFDQFFINWIFFLISSHTSRLLCHGSSVLYFDQRTDAPYAVRWLKSIF